MIRSLRVAARFSMLYFAGGIVLMFFRAQYGEHHALVLPMFTLVLLLAISGAAYELGAPKKPKE